jgi:predicted ATPase
LRGSTSESERAAWRLIEGTVRLIAPFIKELAPREDAHGAVRLEWVDDQNAKFGPAHLSDGTLRAIALIAALGQPGSTLPVLSCIDEPELGLHPAAITKLCALIARVGARSQVIVSTQSPDILDHFEPRDVVVTERHGGATVFKRLDEAALAAWLEDYSLSELYDKNVLGGRP